MRPKLSEDVVSSTEFLNCAPQILEKLRKTRRPIILTRRGRSAAVVEDIKTYQNTMKLLEFLKSLVRGIEAAEQRDRILHLDAMKQLDTLVDE